MCRYVHMRVCICAYAYVYMFSEYMFSVYIFRGKIRDLVVSASFFRRKSKSVSKISIHVHLVTHVFFSDSQTRFTASVNVCNCA